MSTIRSFRVPKVVKKGLAVTSTIRSFRVPKVVRKG